MNKLKGEGFCKYASLMTEKLYMTVGILKDSAFNIPTVIYSIEQFLLNTTKTTV